ncbi:MAG TPA: electron transfer flavoprotein subunit alpha/FixB family protein [Bacteroidota bacterium]|nr:electron transfer flavoprotein subunit alpha/FixB family protein [Bacteroidota bacterium]
MKCIAFAEERDGEFRKSSLETVRAARRMADALGGTCLALVAGHDAGKGAAALGRYGAARVLVVDDARLERKPNIALARIVAAVARREEASLVFLAASQAGKDIAPRVAVDLEAGLAADCVALRTEGTDVIATRPVFAGKALLDVRVTTGVKVFTLRPNVFEAVAGEGAAAVEAITVPLEDADLVTTVEATAVASGRPDVTEADIIVSGGRGMKGPEHFALIEALADALGAGVGASRAVVDAGWRPHDEQVGQTGKTVSPALYIACGISGAVQHLAGMSSSRYIVAINRDKDAPIFQVADYGIVGDVFDVLPALTAALRRQGK